MWSSPDGYGSISRTYVDRCSSAVLGSGFGTTKASSAAQAACHFSSTAEGSYRSCSDCSIGLDSLPGTKKPLGREAQGESARRCRVSSLDYVRSCFTCPMLTGTIG